MSGARACLFLSALLCAARLAAAAGAPLSARMRAEPARPYAGEDFSLVLEVTAAPGSEISLTGLAGLPQTLPLAIESFSAAGARRRALQDLPAHCQARRGGGAARSPAVGDSAFHERR